MTMADLDTDLIANLKMAKTKKMNFVFIPRGGSDGKLILSKKKIPDKEIAEAKKDIGGGAPIKGKCIGEFGAMMFQVLKAPPATMQAALKKVIKLNSGLNVVPNVMTAADAEADEEEEGKAPAAKVAAGATPAGAAAKGVVPAVPPAAGAAAAAAGTKPGGDPKVRAWQEKLKQLGFDPGVLDGIMGKNTQGAIKKFQTAHNLKPSGVVDAQTQAALDAGGAAPAAPPSSGGAPGAPPESTVGGKAPAGKAPPGKTPEGKETLDYGPWIKAREHAVKELRALAAKVAGTKHPDAGAVLKEIDAIIKKLPLKPAPQDIDGLKKLIESDDALAAAEESPKHFHHLEIKKPLLDGLGAIKK
jgi:peptidoglycan hydrolase-like protein with peptidoglycan-binding domain